MILGYDKFWAHYLEDIDIKSYEWPWTGDYWASEVKRYLVQMWMVDNGDFNSTQGSVPKTPRGFIVYRFVNVKDLVDMGEKIKGTVIRIEKLAVHPSWRNQGIGEKLLKSVEVAAEFQDVGILVIFLHEENDLGREWLMKRGFVACRLHPKLFPDGRDAYSFTKDIAS